MATVPDDFEPLFRESNYIQLIGPVYQKQMPDSLRLGLLAEEKHCNARGNIHGGVLAGLVDMSMGYNIAFSQTPPLASVTVSLNVDYMGRVQRNDWIEVETQLERVGRQMVFARSFCTVAGKPVCRANGVFKLLGSVEQK